MSGPILLALRIALAVVLYVFLGWALFILWQDLKKQGEEDAAQKVPTLTLSLKDADGEIHAHQFTESNIIIGRDPAINLHIDDQTISAQHALLSYRLGQWWIEDLNSTNGTFLNQEPVSEQVVITDGDRLRCGRIEFHIAVEGPIL